MVSKNLPHEDHSDFAGTSFLSANMADWKDAYEENVAGKWYVDKKCILCCVCAEAAPKNFKEAASGDHDYVFKQPETEEEVLQCEEAMAACPVEAIGNDRPV